MKAKTHIDELSANGEVAFTFKEMRAALGLTPKAAYCALDRLRDKNEIVSPVRGYYLILPPAFRKVGCLPPEHFIDELMRYLAKPYYVGLLSAAVYHGAAHHQPQTFQVITPQRRLPIHCGNVLIDFVQNKHWYELFVQSIKTPTGTMQISTPELTAMDMMHFMRQSGGIGRITTVLSELIEAMSVERLMQLLESVDEIWWVRRLGYLFDCLEADDLSNILYQHFMQSEQKRIIPLVPYASMTGTKRNKKWRIAINAIVESDIDDFN